MVPLYEGGPCLYQGPRSLTLPGVGDTSRFVKSRVSCFPDYPPGPLVLSYLNDDGLPSLLTEGTGLRGTLTRIVRTGPIFGYLRVCSGSVLPGGSLVGDSYLSGSRRPDYPSGPLRTSSHT